MEKGDALRIGRGIEPDRAAAVASYEKACQLGEARGCLEAARLYRRGWMFEVERKRERSRELATEATKKAPGCGTSDGCVVSFDAQLLLIEQLPPIDSAKTTSTLLLADAQKGCEKTAEACRWIHENAAWFGNHLYVEKNTVTPMIDKADAALESQCKKTSNPASCYWAGKYASKKEIAAKYFEPACKGNYKNACWELWDAKIDLAKPTERGPVVKEALAVFEPACQTNPTKECSELAELFVVGYERDGVKIPKDVPKALKLVDGTCKVGEVEACEALGRVYGEGKLVAADPAKAKESLARACRLTEPEDTCRLCESSPNAPECQLRKTWDTARSCESGDENACDAVGNAFRGKTTGKRDHVRAARYYRRACDSAVKTACASIDEMCVAGDVEPALCQQSLIHTDLFFEAEWQFRHTGKATLASTEEVAKNTDKVAGLDVPAVNASAGGASFKRGSLDADLVVGIVLDRARQAAIEIVVDELKEAGAGRVAGYLRDLLGQAALLLGDKNTLRREKLTDLARTVVRALLASNLVNTLYADPVELIDGPLFTEWNGKPWKVKWRPADRERLRRYLTDWTYYLLGETKLFVGAGTKIAAKVPACAFSRPHAQLCDWLVEKDKPNYERLKELLHIHQFVDGLGLARVIRQEHEVDLRRLVEALGRSKSIANFSATPGLNLQVWERELVGGVEGRLRELREEVDAIAKLVEPGSYTNTPAWADLQNWGRTTRRFLSDRGAAALLSRDQQSRLSDLTKLLVSLPPVGPPGTAQVASETERAQKVATDIAAKLGTWDSATRSDLIVRISELRRRITTVKPHITALSRQIDEIRGALRRLSHGGLAIDEIPLAVLPELNESLDGALTELKKLDEELRALFPGTHRTQMRFAMSAVVRLRGFLSLMDRISRRAPLNQTVGELMASVKMLGNVRKGRFSAPLFDVVEPALDVIATHRPLDADVLFSMISRARLDSLITSLEGTAGQRPPCERDEGGTECWTVKVIHALQESVQRDAEIIRVDGGQFAKRLAIHGDDFRRRHQWGSFFHLTVGFGAMYSTKPPEMSGGTVVEGKNRTVPIVAEQIGFGMASPTFFRDKLTFKMGLYGSGILYRMVLDSAESSAVSLGGFMAFDIHNLVELYVAPAVMLYPPEGDRSLTPRLGISAGISVPLGAYLSKLTE